MECIYSGDIIWNQSLHYSSCEAESWYQVRTRPLSHEQGSAVTLLHCYSIKWLIKTKQIKLNEHLNNH